MSMTDNEMCMACNYYDADNPCEYQEHCAMLALVRENRKLKKQLYQAQHSANTYKRKFEDLEFRTREIKI